MQITSRKTLGLAVTQQAITAVEVVTARGRHKASRAAELPLGGEVNFQNPPALGKALKDLLQRGRFTSSRCVIGLDAVYVAAKEKRLPPAAAASLTDILRLASEQDFASEGEGLLFDFWASSDTNNLSALLVAVPRPVVDGLLAAAQAAGLSVAAVTSNITATAQVSLSPAAQGERLLLVLSPGGAELMVESGGMARLVRRLPPAPGSAEDASPEARRRYVADLETEILRLLASGGEGRPAPRELLIWNSTALEPTELKAIGEALGIAVRIGRMPQDLGGLDDMESGGSLNPVSATAVAMACANGRAPALDFLHSRLAPPRQRRFGRVAMLATAAAVVLIAAGVYLWLDWRSTRRAIAEMQMQRAQTTTAVRQAKDLITKADLARTWYDKRPRYLDCLRELALAFPEEGRIWATALNVTPSKGDLKVVITGKAVSEGAVLEVLDRLKNNPRLSGVESKGIRPVGAGSREVQFTINFNMVGAG